jgi:hypothetical protein
MPGFIAWASAVIFVWVFRPALQQTDRIDYTRIRFISIPGGNKMTPTRTVVADQNGDISLPDLRNIITSLNPGDADANNGETVEVSGLSHKSLEDTMELVNDLRDAGHDLWTSFPEDEDEGALTIGAEIDTCTVVIAATALMKARANQMVTDAEWEELAQAMEIEAGEFVEWRTPEEIRSKEVTSGGTEDFTDLESI